MQSAMRGGVSRYPLLADAFSSGFGGHSGLMSTWLELMDRKDATSTGELVSHAEFLKTVIPRLSAAVGELNITMDALAKDAKGPLRLSSADRNTLRMRTRVYFVPSAERHMFADADNSSFELESPVKDTEYRASLAKKLRGKTLNQIDGVQLQIEARVSTDVVTLTGSDTGLHRHDGLGTNSRNALAPFAKKSGVDGEPGEREIATALWRLHMQDVTLPENAIIGG